MNCRHCGAVREAGDDHYGRCLVIRMALDKSFFPVSEIKQARNAEKRIGKATGVSGDGIGWRKIFVKKHNGQSLRKARIGPLVGNGGCRRCRQPGCGRVKAR